MKLEQQLTNLINEAPNYGVPANVMELGVIPVLRMYAENLDYEEYYLRQNLDDRLIMTILSNNNQPGIEKKVIYAFPSVKDAARFQDNKDPEIIAKAFPISQILFQMFTIKEIDSIVFIEQPNDLKQSKEILCQDLRNAINEQLKIMLTPTYIPYNIA